MRKRMGTGPVKVQGYWSWVFGDGESLENDDLTQEAYLTYIKCQEAFDQGKASFQTFYSACVYNHFVNLYNRSRWERQHFSPVDRETSQIPYESWSQEDELLWEELLSQVRHMLSGLELKVFNALVEPPVELATRNKDGKPSNKRLADWLGVSEIEVKRADYPIKCAALLVLGYRGKRLIRMMERMA